MVCDDGAVGDGDIVEKLGPFLANVE